MWFPSLACALILLAAGCSSPDASLADDGADAAMTTRDPLRDEARATIRAAGDFFATQVARHGGYAWHQRLGDLDERWGDIQLDVDQIMVQSPGTADVAVAFVEAAEADPQHEAFAEHARAAALALTRGQVQSGGWRLYADFKASPTLEGCYLRAPANCGCPGCNFTTFDDQATQNALVAVMRADALLDYVDADLAASSAAARAAIPGSQYPGHGGFPQGFTAAVAARPALAASYPPSTGTACGLAMCFVNDYEDEYWDDPTLNDDIASAMVAMLWWAKTLYPDEAATYDAMLDAYGAFLLRAQMPSPQPAWAQQYDRDMQPRWARSWEAPAIAGSESQDVMWALLRLHQLYPDSSDYRDAVGSALDFLEPLEFDGKIKRYIELDDSNPSNVGFQTVKPGGYPAQFSLEPPTYQNYGWEPVSQLAELRAEYERLAIEHTPRQRSCSQLRLHSEVALAQAVDGDKWVTAYPEGPRSGATPGDYLDTAVFATNLRTLAELIRRTDPGADCAL